MEKLKGYFFTGLGVAFLGMCSAVYGMESVLKDNTSSSSFTVKEGTSNSTLFMVSGDGNVGIGTTNLIKGVYISRYLNGEHLILKLENTGPYSAAGVELKTSASDNDWILAAQDTGGGSAEGFRIQQWSTTGSPVRMAINVSGNVGIGTTAPSSKLEVSGGDIRVTSGSFIDDGTTLNVPDYVFDTKYILKPIAQVKAYIQKHKHLEGLPDTNDRKGWSDLSMQDRDMKLLEKIEELTLYVIQLKEENDTLKQRVKVLENVKLAANK